MLFLATTFSIFNVNSDEKYSHHNTLFFNNGLSPLKIWKYSFIFSVAMLFISLFFSLQITPITSTYLSEKIFLMKKQNSKIPQIQEHTFVKISPKLTFYSSKNLPENNFENTLIHVKYDTKNFSIFSKLSEIKNKNLDQRVFSSLFLSNGVLTSFFKKNKSTLILKFKTYEITMASQKNQPKLEERFSFLNYSNYIDKIGGTNKKERQFYIARLINLLFLAFCMPFMSLVAGWMSLGANQGFRSESRLKKNYFAVSLFLVSALIQIRHLLNSWSEKNTLLSIGLSLSLLLILYGGGGYLLSQTSSLFRKSQRTIKSS